MAYGILIYGTASYILAKILRGSRFGFTLIFLALRPRIHGGIIGGFLATIFVGDNFCQVYISPIFFIAGNFTMKNALKMSFIFMILRFNFISNKA